MNSHPVTFNKDWKGQVIPSQHISSTAKISFVGPDYSYRQLIKDKYNQNNQHDMLTNEEFRVLIFDARQQIRASHPDVMKLHHYDTLAALPKTTCDNKSFLLFQLYEETLMLSTNRQAQEALLIGSIQNQPVWNNPKSKSHIWEIKGDRRIVTAEEFEYGTNNADIARIFIMYPENLKLISKIHDIDLKSISAREQEDLLKEIAFNHAEWKKNTPKFKDELTAWHRDLESKSRAVEPFMPKISNFPDI